MLGVRQLSILTGFVFLICSCGSPDDENVGKLPPGYSRAGTLAVEHRMTIGEKREVYFGNIVDIEADSLNRIFVSDSENNHIWVFSSKGDSLGRIGEEGNAPGEFQSLNRLFVVDNQLVAVDLRQDRLSHFDLSTPFRLIGTVPLPELENGTYRGVIHADPEGFLATIGRDPNSDETGLILRPRSVRIAAISSKGKMLRDSLLAVPGPQAIKDYQGDMPLVIRPPLGKEPEFAVGPERTLFYGRTDSLRIERYSSDGEHTTTIRLPYEPVRATGEEIDSLIGRYPQQVRNTIRKARGSSTHPTFTDLHVDDRGRLWMDVNERLGSSSSTWRIVDFKEKEVSAVTLPANVQIRSIADGKIYGTQTGAKGVQEVAVFAYEQP